MKVIAVTGGGAGIGRGIAWHFARAGYRVSIIDADRQAGRESLQVMREAGVEVVFMAGDVSKPADVNRWLAQTRAKLGCPDKLVNNAGIEVRKDVLRLSIAEFDRVIATNLRGTFICSQAVAKMMVRHGGSRSAERGVIINIASTRAFMSEPGTEGYTASKGGIVALTHGMAISLAQYRIRVNCISPGWIEAGDWQKAARARKPHHSQADREQHPVGRVGTPDDVARACQFIAEDAGFMTGQNLILDGGMTVKMIYV
jgi:NAD(P)-dependent dehydrogenase (short-subunit alcohol dehydrogenase family)